MVKKNALLQENFVDLHDRIIAGDAAKPSMFTRRGRAYRKCRFGAVEKLLQTLDAV